MAVGERFGRRTGAGAPAGVDGGSPGAQASRSGRARGLLDALVAASRPTARELLVATLLLAALGYAAYASHILGGGFVMDDWSNAAKTRDLVSCCGRGVTNGGANDYFNVSRSMRQDGPAGYHLGLTAIAPLAHFFLGEHTGWHLALAVGLGVLMSAALYLLLRTLGLAPLHSTLIAGLVLIFPFTDSIRLWPMASYNQIAVVLYLVGAVVALGGLRRPSTRRAAGLHALALGLFAAGILIYELIAGAVLLTAVLYIGRTTWRNALVRWVADVAVAAITLSYALSKALPRLVLPWEGRLEHARVMLDLSGVLFDRVLVPFGDPPRSLPTLIVLAILAAAALVWRRASGHDRFRGELRRWLLVAALGLVTIVAGYALIVPASYGSPLDAGIENRLNMVASIGWVALAYAGAMLVGLLVARAARVAPARAVAAPLLLTAFLGVGYLVRLDESKAHYEESYAEQRQVLDSLRELGPYPRRATIYVFGQPAFTAPGVPVFAWIWDLNPAAKLALNPSVQAHPMLPETKIRCAEKTLFPRNRFAFGKGQAGRYGKTVFVDVERGVSERITSPANCRAARQRFRPGPTVRGRDCTLLGGGPATRLAWFCND